MSKRKEGVHEIQWSDWPEDFRHQAINGRILSQKNQPIMSNTGRIYDIQFGPDLMCQIKVTLDAVEVVAAMNGWGNAIPLDQIQITPHE